MTTPRMFAVKRSASLVFAGALLAMSMSEGARAEVPGITKVASSGTGVSVKTSALSAVAIDIGLAKAQGSSPPAPYSPTATNPTYSNVLGLGTSVNLLGIVNLGTLGLALGASPNADTCAICSSANSAFSGANSTANTGYAEVNNLGVTLQGTTTITLPLAPPIVTTTPIVGLTADTVKSTTTFNGSKFVQTSNITDLDLDVLGVLSLVGGIVNNATSIGATVNASTPANTVLLNIPGLISIILNEQTMSYSDVGNGMRTTTATTNAIHISLSDLIAGGSLLRGDVIVGQSTASYTRAIPEATTWVMLILGFGAIGGTLRSRHRAKRREDAGLARLAA